jgi:hypothetical protein
MELFRVLENRYITQKTMQFVSRSLYPRTLGVNGIEEGTGTLVLDLKETQWINFAKNTAEQVVDSIKMDLFGYTEIN